ncbi:hypothetical protein HanRHA438_Chr07g0300381 [Helianthus annuus]|nr:hypothetical protein HanHA300_Chr07g0238321 [Helianthus annuus]KAJ0556335.1 hypothetical protein HanIR_Chr07g0312621 [Helianthus annuus]KAJ0562774.1 hypothetical protein HanHA89_Chr07g0255501 [Helianthus annuus]KAJ0730919.1 hypothetical protein HanOQP8_Chr07g0245951 [Helianthus annuus]KAJ0907551.1 hypothetical protein HanRHA438_Chr07g0300381 [Helianthus annuus]
MWLNLVQKIKAICDQLAAIRHPVSDMDKSHWFLCGLGSAFETFSIAQRTIHPQLTFRDLLSKAESHELFLASLHGSSQPQVAFSARQQPSQNTRYQSYHGRGRSSRSSRSSFSGNHGRGKRPPQCQPCRHDGHYAPARPTTSSFAQNSS